MKCPIGYERATRKDGMVMVRIEKGWDYKQRVVWRKHHGEIPKGHYIIFLDGDRTNYDIENLACVSPRESSLIANYRLITNNQDLTKTGVDLVKLLVKIKEKEGIKPKSHKKRKIEVNL